MKYEEAGIGTVVCLLCGAKCDLSELVIEDIRKLDVPEDIKTKGGFFQAVVCPSCKKSIYLGFIASKIAPETKRVVKTKAVAPAKTKKQEQSDDVIQVDEGESDALMNEMFGGTDEPKVKSQSKKRAKPNRRKPLQAKCSQCDKTFECGDIDYGVLGTKCPACLKRVVRG